MRPNGSPRDLDAGSGSGGGCTPGAPAPVDVPLFQPFSSARRAPQASAQLIVRFGVMIWNALLCAPKKPPFFGQTTYLPSGVWR